MSSCETCGREIKNYGIFLGGIRCANHCRQLPSETLPSETRKQIMRWKDRNPGLSVETTCSRWYIVRLTPIIGERYFQVFELAQPWDTKYPTMKAAKAAVASVNRQEREAHKQTGQYSPQRLEIARSWAERIEQHATQNYSGTGWDYIVECWSQAEIIDEIAWCSSYTSARAKMKQIATAMRDREQEIRNF